jgi:hypothetical protein
MEMERITHPQNNQQNPVFHLKIYRKEVEGGKSHMSRRACRPAAKLHQRLEPQRTNCLACGEVMWVAYHTQRSVLTLQGLCRLTIVIRRCRNASCSQYQHAYHPEEEGRWALPHGECGLDLIAQVGALRYREHRSIGEIHQHLRERQLQICERTVEQALHRYDELVSVYLHQKDRLHALMHKQGRAILAIDGLQPDVGHEVLWVIREVLSGEILLARALLSSSQEDLATLLTEVKKRYPFRSRVWCLTDSFPSARP